MVQWLRFCTPNAGDTDVILVGELGSYMPPGTAKKVNI